MKLIDGVSLSNLCDYSFGDQSGSFGNVPGHFMKNANLLNLEFVKKVLSTNKKCITLFIDNIRLYKREITNVKPQDRSYVNSLMKEHDLLELCSSFPNKKFIIFTNLEDTPIDDYIFDKIPDNVLSINAVNSISYGGKVNPIPYGVQRKLSPNDDRINILTSLVNSQSFFTPIHLLYVNHSENTNKDRIGIVDIFKNKSWAIASTSKKEYSEYLNNINLCKFVICPIGNAIDCHRNWEVLYMRRVPVMKKNDYLEYLMKDYPVLFVDDYSDVTEDLLIANEYLFNNMQEINLDNLDIQNFYDRIVNNSIKKNDQSS
jgi:hypothetical protein